MSGSTDLSPASISADRLKELLDSGAAFELVDTRDRESFESWRIADATGFPYKPFHEFDPEAFIAETGIEREDQIVTICAKAKSSRVLADELTRAGFTDVRFVQGGMKAWSSVYDTVDVDTDGSVEIVQLQRRAKGCLGYLVADPDTERAAVVDPSRHTDVYVEAATERGWTIERVFDTHIHADHISGGAALANRLGVPYHLGENVADRGVEIDYEPLQRNEVRDIGSVPIKAVFTPGHTSGMVSYLIGSEALMTGDTVFVDSVGRTELQFGDADAASGAELLYDSLHGTILAEPDSVTVLPGHFDVSNDDEYAIDPGTEISTTIESLRTTVPILQEERDLFLERIVKNTNEKPPNYERVIAINLGQANADADEAIELELGPNRCAAE